MPLVISFATFPDETAMQADYIFPDHHGLESWGYQRIATGPRPTLSGAQPAVVPFFNTRATVDVLLAAAQGRVAAWPARYPFRMRLRLFRASCYLWWSKRMPISTPEINAFTANFQQFGGWWQMSYLFVASGRCLCQPINVDGPI